MQTGNDNIYLALVLLLLLTWDKINFNSNLGSLFQYTGTALRCLRAWSNTNFLYSTRSIVYILKPHLISWWYALVDYMCNISSSTGFRHTCQKSYNDCLLSLYVNLITFFVNAFSATFFRHLANGKSQMPWNEIKKHKCFCPLQLHIWQL